MAKSKLYEEIKNAQIEYDVQNVMKIEITDKEFSELLDDHLSHLGELFRKAHTEGLDKMFDEPKHLSGDFINFIKTVRQQRKKNY